MDFGAWLPDLPSIGHDGLTEARNVYASALGYKPVKSLSAVTEALSETWKGGGSFKDVDGTTVTLAGANGGLYAYISSAWTNKVAGSYTAKWQFAQYGAFIICVNGGAPLKYTISTATGATLGGTPPNSTMIAIVRDFVFLAGDSSANSTVYWSANNNAEGWTIGTGEADSQQLPDGGEITGLAGGEFGLVFQEAAIHRFSYVGPPLIFQRDKVVEGIGCVAPGAVTQFGRMAFFLSQRGFYAYLDGELRPIGKNKVDDTFWSLYSRADVINNIRATIDPERALVIWSMPDRLWVYNWDIDRWSDIYIPGVVGISTGINASVSLEDVDTLYPSGLDSVPYSLDDPIFKGGQALLTVVKSDNIVYSFGSSTNLQATLRMATQEIVPGRDTRVRRARVIGDMTDGTLLSVYTSQRLGDAATTVEATSIRTSGDMPIRVRGRYLQPGVTITAGTDWTYLKGLELELAAGARR